MLGLLIWLAGCVFGLWAMIHWHLWRDAVAFVSAVGLVIWILGGATYFGRRGGAQAARPRGAAPSTPQPKA